MVKRDQHFVPQLYLRLFASDQDGDRRQISLYLLKRGSTIHDVSIKDQCQRKWFYGKNEQVEDWFSSIENTTAKALNQIRKSRELPQVDTDEYAALLFFRCIAGSPNKKEGRRYPYA